MLAVTARVLGHNGVDGREHAADAEARDESPDQKMHDAGRYFLEQAKGERRSVQALSHDARFRRGHEHADTHDDETAERRRSPTELIGDAAEKDRADRHADELHRQNDAEQPPLDPVLGAHARRGQRNGDDIEPIERVQHNRQDDDNNLQCTHRRDTDELQWILVVHSLRFPPRRPVPAALTREPSTFLCSGIRPDADQTLLRG